jgi:hypothetical protein
VTAAAWLAAMVALAMAMEAAALLVASLLRRLGRRGAGPKP